MGQDDKEQTVAGKQRPDTGEVFDGESDLEAVDEYMRSQGYVAAKGLLKKNEAARSETAAGETKNKKRER